MVDYSKWDNIDVSDDEEQEEDIDDFMEEEEEEEQQQQQPVQPTWDKPRVTKLEGPTSVTIGAHGAHGENVSQAPSRAIVAPAVGPPVVKKPVEKKDLEAKFTENGGKQEGRFLWSQTSSEACLSIFLPAGTKGRDVTVKCSEPADDLGSDQKVVLTVSFASVDPMGNRTHTQVIDGLPLAYRIQRDEDTGIDWELTDFEPGGRRLARLTLVKHAPAGMVVWWTRVFPDDDPVDVSQISGRKHNAGDHQKVWEQAHAMFREKVKDRQPMELDC